MKVVASLASAVAGLVLGVALFVAAQPGNLSAPESAKTAAQAFCDEHVAAGLYANCTVGPVVAVSPETDSVYAQYAFKLTRSDVNGPGERIVLVYLEGDEVVAVR